MNPKDIKLTPHDLDIYLQALDKGRTRFLNNEKERKLIDAMAVEAMSRLKGE
jgi:hypothetical protein